MTPPSRCPSLAKVRSRVSSTTHGAAFCEMSALTAAACHQNGHIVGKQSAVCIMLVSSFCDHPCLSSTTRTAGTGAGCSSARRRAEDVDEAEPEAAAAEKEKVAAKGKLEGTDADSEPSWMQET